MTDGAQNLRDSAVSIVRTLRGAGHVAYLAGGCVRDALLGLEPKDYDVATDARPEAVRDLFRRSQFVGEAFGVVLVYAQGRPFEVATFRTEWGYEDGRRPGSVKFSDAEHDAQRRDFTVNGLFADPLDEDLEPLPAGGDRVIDYVGGRADLEARVLRAIGVPAERFGEDYLRLLRAARFASRLGFEIDPATADAVRAASGHLGVISRERIGQEVMLMLTGADPVRAAELMQELDLDAPALAEAHVEGSRWTLRAVRGLFESEAPHGRTRGVHPWASDERGYGLTLAAWMLDRADASGSLRDAAAFVTAHATEKVTGWRKALCLSNGDRDVLSHVLRLLPRAAQWDTLDVAKRKRLLADDAWPGAWALARVLGPGDVIARIDADTRPLIDAGVAPPPFVTGEDLLGMGFEAGPRIGDLLDAVYDAQLDGRVRDRAAALDWVKGLGNG
jgi:poly(A) polymerase